jgi:branched-chain amino acid transport system substrate-binding protein
VRYAKKLGIRTVPGKPQAWDKNATSYEAIASRVDASGADAIFLGGIICNNGGKLIKDLRAGVDANVKIIGPDGWTPISATVQGAGQAAEGMYITQPGIPPDQLKGAGKEFVDGFEAEVGHPPDPYTNYAAQAAQILLDSIADSDGTRASVSEALFNRDVPDGILGNFKIDENGDTTLGTVAVFIVKGGEGTFNKTITPELSFVKG